MAYEKVPTRKKGRWCLREEAKLAANRTRRQEDKKEVEYFEEDVMSQRNIDDNKELARYMALFEQVQNIIKAAINIKKNQLDNSDGWTAEEYELVLAIEDYEKAKRNE